MKLTSTEYQIVLNFFKKAVEMEPAKWSYWSDIGFCHGKLGQWRESVAAFERILDKTEATAAVLSMLGHAYIKLEDYLKAEILLHRAHTMAPNNLGVLYKLAVVYFHLGEIEMALDPLQQIIRHKPGHIKAHFSLGLVYHRLHDQQAAERQLSIVKDLSPKYGQQLAAILQG